MSKKTGLQNIEYEIWNEPNSHKCWSWSQAHFFEAWKQAYQAIRSRDSDAVIVGPNISAFDFTWLVDYRIAELEFQRDMGVLEVNEKGLWRG